MPTITQPSNVADNQGVPEITDSLRLYRSQITRIKRTSPEEERLLMERISHREQDRQEAELAKCRMVEANLRFVYMLARRYAAQGVDVLDLIQEGNLALIHAVEKYNPQKGKFSTYAGFWVAKAIFRALARHAHLVAIPEYKRVELRRLERAERHLEQTAAGTHGSTAHLADSLHISEQHIKELSTLLVAEYQRAESLDMTYEEGEFSQTWADLIEDDPRYSPEEEVCTLTLQERIRHLLATELTPMERTVVQLRFGLGNVDAQGSIKMARKLGVSHTIVNQILQRAMQKLAQRCQDLHEYL